MRIMLAVSLSCCCVFSHANAEEMLLLDVVSLLPTQHAEAEILKQVLANYPGKYLVEQVNRHRARERVRTGNNVCMPWLQKTPERLREYQFSLPYMLEDSLQLVLRQHSAAHRKILQSTEPVVSLQQLLATQMLLLGIEQNRSYGAELDTILTEAQQLHNPSLYLRTTPSQDVGSLLPMLDRDFLDAIIEYPKIAKRSGLPLVYYPIKEAPAVNLVYFACSNTAVGTRIIAKLNQSIQTLAAQADYRNLVLAQLPFDSHAQALQYWQSALATDSSVK